MKNLKTFLLSVLIVLTSNLPAFSNSGETVILSLKTAQDLKAYILEVELSRDFAVKKAAIWEEAAREAKGKADSIAALAEKEYEKWKRIVVLKDEEILILKDALYQLEAKNKLLQQKLNFSGALNVLLTIAIAVISL